MQCANEWWWLFKYIDGVRQAQKRWLAFGPFCIYGGMREKFISKKNSFFGGKGFIYFRVTRALGRLTRRTSAKGHADFFLDWLAQGLVLSVVLLAQVENLDNIVNPILHVGICVI